MRIVLVFLLLALASVVHAQPLWGNTKLGMSIADLRQAYPAAIEVKNEPTRLGGASDQWELDGVTIADEPFAASFVFREHRLDAVLLRPATRDSAKFPTLIEALRSALTQKYGANPSQEEVKGEYVHATVWTWFKDGTTIALEVINGPSRPLSIQVRYDAKASKAGENL